jgi:NADPH:quinone reductase-like Zn-dependent oxidoreductase
MNWKMKTAFRSKYGTGKVLTIKDVDIPTPKENELLIRVYAATADRTTYHNLTGKPFFMRMFTGLFKPRRAVTGCDLAGQIEAVGKNVLLFKVGDKVMGMGGVFDCGSHAQYIVLPETKGIVKMPDDISFEQAAACCEGTFYAASLARVFKIDAGKKVLVYGATGAIGSAYVQLLKARGLYVTAVCRGEHFELVKSLGADKVVDYTVTDFTTDNEKYDLVLDAVGKSSFLKCKRLLNKKGIFTSSGGAENFLWALITPLLGGKKVIFPPGMRVKPTLEFVKDQIKEGKFKPLIDRVYPLEKIAEAFDYVGSEQKLGNVVITMQ